MLWDASIVDVCRCRMRTSRRIFLPMARLLRHGDKVYLTDDNGGTWRVYDVAFGPPYAPPGKKRVVPFESSRATYRWFVSKDGTHRCHLFEKGESRELTDEVSRTISIGRDTWCS